MDKAEKVKVLFNLFETLNLYYEERDRPAGINFTEDLKTCCDILDIDYEELKNQFKLKMWE